MSGGEFVQCLTVSLCTVSDGEFVQCLVVSLCSVWW